MRITSLARRAACHRQFVGSTCIALAVVLAIVRFPAPAAAQSPTLDSLVRVGARVDLRTWRTNASVPAMSSRLIGTVVARDAAELQIRDERSGAVVTVATRQLARVSVGMEGSRHTVLGAMVGFSAGMVAGYVAGETCQARQYGCDGNPSTRAEHAARGSGAGAVAGALVGAAVGYLIHTGRWRRVVASSGTALRVNPGSPRTTVTVSHPF